MNQTRWNCYHDPCCQKGAADCRKCKMFRQKMEIVIASTDSTAVERTGYQEPDPYEAMENHAKSETRLDRVEGQGKYLQAKLQQHITAGRKRLKDSL